MLREPERLIEAPPCEPSSSSTTRRSAESTYNALRITATLRQVEPEIEFVVFLLGDAVVCAKHGQTTPQGYSAEWTAQQVIRAFPEKTAPRLLLRDRDNIYGERFQRTVAPSETQREAPTALVRKLAGWCRIEARERSE